ncbi:MAG: hypothetical protein JWO67_4531 [Streptosporangiaceae bacterium]|nr:hypothetical protein [Streptosporangiaceae bacterium]
MADPVMSLAEVAEFLGIKPESASRLLRRHGIKPRRGYLRSEVKSLERQQGRRTDLHKED